MNKVFIFFLYFIILGQNSFLVSAYRALEVAQPRMTTRMFSSEVFEKLPSLEHLYRRLDFIPGRDVKMHTLDSLYKPKDLSKASDDYKRAFTVGKKIAITDWMDPKDWKNMTKDAKEYYMRGVLNAVELEADAFARKYLALSPEQRSFFEQGLESALALKEVVRNQPDTEAELYERVLGDMSPSERDILIKASKR